MKPPEQFLLFDAAEAKRLGIEGMEKAAQPTSVQIWFAAATATHDSWPVGHQYSADDIIRENGLVREVDRDRNNYVGTWFRDMKAAGRIAEIRMIRSKRVSNHGKKIPLYRKVY
jgi:hypothetical protein